LKIETVTALVIRLRRNNIVTWNLG